MPCTGGIGDKLLNESLLTTTVTAHTHRGIPRSGGRRSHIFATDEPRKPTSYADLSLRQGLETRFQPPLEKARCSWRDLHYYS